MNPLFSATQEQGLSSRVLIGLDDTKGVRTFWRTYILKNSPGHNEEATTVSE